MKKMISMILTASLLLGSGIVPTAASSEVESVPSLVRSLAAGKNSDSEPAAGADADSESAGVLDEIVGYLSEKTSGLTETAGELAGAASSAAKDAAKQAEKMAEEALASLTGAANLVIDQTGAVIDIASENADKATESVLEAYKIIKEGGERLSKTAHKIIAKIDLSDEEQINEAKEAVEYAADLGYKRGMFGDILSKETFQVVVDIVFGAALYGAQYVNQQIDLKEYASLMSEMIIREGLPAGVGFVADRIPIPGAKHIATEVTAFLIEKAYGSETEEVLEEAS